MTSTDPREMQALLDRPLDELLEELDLYDADPRAIWLGLGRHRRPRPPTPLRRMGLVRDRQDARFENDVDLAMVVVGVLSVHVLNLPFGVDASLIAAIVVKTRAGLVLRLLTPDP